MRNSDADDEEWNLTAKEAGLLFRRSSDAEDIDNLFAEIPGKLGGRTVLVDELLAA